MARGRDRKLWDEHVVTEYADGSTLPDVPRILGVVVIVTVFARLINSVMMAIERRVRLHR